MVKEIQRYYRARFWSNKEKCEKVMTFRADNKPNAYDHARHVATVEDFGVMEVKFLDYKEPPECGKLKKVY